MADSSSIEAIRFATEEMPGEFLDGTILETENDRIDGAGILALYDSPNDQA